jgi:hypothetical protein
MAVLARQQRAIWAFFRVITTLSMRLYRGRVLR